MKVRGVCTLPPCQIPEVLTQSRGCPQSSQVLSPTSTLCLNSRYQKLMLTHCKHRGQGKPLPSIYKPTGWLVFVWLTCSFQLKPKPLPVIKHWANRMANVATEPISLLFLYVTLNITKNLVFKSKNNTLKLYQFFILRAGNIRNFFPSFSMAAVALFWSVFPL